MGTPEQPEDINKMKQHARGLVSVMAHLVGLREARGDGKLFATVGDGDEVRGRECVHIENIGVNAGQSWEPGALLSVVGDLKVLPEAKIQQICARVEEVVKANPKPTPVLPPPPPVVRQPASEAVKKPAGGGEEFESMSKGPSGFYPPRKVPAAATTAKRVESEAQQVGQSVQVRGGGGGVGFPAGNRSGVGGGGRPDTGSNLSHQRNGVGASTSRTNRWIPAESQGSKEDPPQEPSKPGAFRSAYEQLIIDDKKKGIQRNYPPSTGTARAQGLRKTAQKAEAPPPRPSSPDSEAKISDNPEVLELMTHECMKNIDPKMVEAILNEIIDRSTTTWDDIAGLEGVKKIIREIIIWPMERPDIFTGLRSAPKGILFFGPPGTGKTMFGKVIATQSKSTFFNISASSLTSKWIGDGEKMVRALFAVARVKAPSVIFIDEIDSILTQRSDSEHESSRRMKTEFLIQFDGCGTSTEERILVIGVTNRPQELDEAARRRLVKRIYIPLPDFEARRQLVKNLIKEYSSDLAEEDFDKIADKTSGYSGADMNSLCREAAYGPIREVGHQIRTLDLDNVRPMRMKDFAHAMKLVKSSVAVTDVQLYEDWDSKFGCHLGPDMDTSQISQVDSP